MRHWGAWVAYLGLAGVCLMWVGCGGSDIPDPDSDPHAAKGPAPPAMPSPPPAVAETVTPAPEVTPRPASAEPASAEAVAKTEPVPAPTEILAPAPPASGGSGSEPARNVTPAASPDVNGPPANQPTGAPDNGIQNAPRRGTGAQLQPLPTANFHNPYTAVVAFLTALKAKNLDALAEATALHAPTEARSRKYQKLFAAILDQSLSDDDLNELVKSMDGYQIVGSDTPHSSGRLGITLMKPEGMGRMIRTVEVRHEKKGWKVVDISPKRAR